MKASLSAQLRIHGYLACTQSTHRSFFCNMPEEKATYKLAQRNGKGRILKYKTIGGQRKEGRKEEAANLARSQHALQRYADGGDTEDG